MQHKPASLSRAGCWNRSHCLR